MSRKITWKNIYDDFQLRFPNFKKQVTYWQPYGYLTIKLYLKGEKACLYDYFNRKITFVER